MRAVLKRKTIDAYEELAASEARRSPDPGACRARPPSTPVVSYPPPAQELAAQKEGLETVQTSLRKAAITPATAERRDEEVGGIPVDSDYVIFIVDTSGSMQNIWSRVTSEMKSVLAIHPKVKGFQIMNDMGTH